MPETFTPQELQRIWIKRFINSFGTSIRAHLKSALYQFHGDVEASGLSEEERKLYPEGLKLTIKADGFEQFAFLKRKHAALRYRIKKSAPTIRTLLIIHLPLGEKVPTKYRGLNLQAGSLEGPCRVIDIASGRFIDGIYELDCEQIPVLTREQLTQILDDAGLAIDEEGDE
jgi:hypothetical protein